MSGRPSRGQFNLALPLDWIVGWLDEFFVIQIGPRWLESVTQWLLLLAIAAFVFMVAA